jgi:hypothetical protein
LGFHRDTMRTSTELRPKFWFMYPVCHSYHAHNIFQESTPKTGFKYLHQSFHRIQASLPSQPFLGLFGVTHVVAGPVSPEAQIHHEAPLLRLQVFTIFLSNKETHLIRLWKIPKQGETPSGKSKHGGEKRTADPGRKCLRTVTMVTATIQVWPKLPAERQVDFNNLGIYYFCKLLYRYQHAAAIVGVWVCAWRREGFFLTNSFSYGSKTSPWK